MPEWSIWYHYLLAALLPRSHEAYVSYLLESVLTGFMAMPESLVEPWLRSVLEITSPHWRAQVMVCVPSAVASCGDSHLAEGQQERFDVVHDVCHGATHQRAE